MGHAEIVRDGEGLRVRDLGSKNGTFVNCARIQESPLRQGDIIHFGDAEFRIGGSPGALDIYWHGHVVGRVEDPHIETTEFVPASPWSPAVVRSAKLRGRWVRLAGASADAFARAVEEGTQR